MKLYYALVALFISVTAEAAVLSTKLTSFHSNPEHVLADSTDGYVTIDTRRRVIEVDFNRAPCPGFGDPEVVCAAVMNYSVRARATLRRAYQGNCGERVYSGSLRYQNGRTTEITVRDNRKFFCRTFAPVKPTELYVKRTARNGSYEIFGSSSRALRAE